MAQKFSVAIQSDTYKTLINNTLGDPVVARRFIADISSVVAINPMLQDCDPGSILAAGFLAQSLNLPMASSLGFAYIVPYVNKTGKKAQFQVGYKGLIQLAQRTGLYERIGVRPVHKGEYVGQDEFGDDVFKFSHDHDAEPIVGYYAYFRLLNGFSKSLYWTVAQCEAHGRRYSKTGKLWSDKTDGGFEAMAQKTVLKMLLSKYGPMSTELQTAVQADQASIREDGSYEYVDNAPSQPEEPKGKTTIALESAVSTTEEITPESFMRDLQGSPSDDDPF